MNGMSSISYCWDKLHAQRILFEESHLYELKESQRYELKCHLNATSKQQTRFSLASLYESSRQKWYLELLQLSLRLASPFQH
jgi:hypothetical protein